MSTNVYNISLLNLGMIMALTAVVFVIHLRWSLKARTILYALFRMLTQLLLVGYFLVYLFNNQSSWLIVLLLSCMLGAASWIALRPVRDRKALYTKALCAILCGGGTTLILVVGIIIPLEPWYEARYVIPLAGMIFANAMNAVSLSAERFDSEIRQGKDAVVARNAAYEAALIPMVNSLFAVGIVSLPGMMTGQILSGVSPLIAVRYQILVMCMILSASGISAAVFLTLSLAHETRKSEQ